MAAVEIGHDGAGRADGLIEEKNRHFGRHVAEAVVIEDFHNGNFRGSGHGLGEFVVVDEDELARGTLEEVAFGKDSLKVSVLVDHGEDELVRKHDRAPGQLQRCVGVEFHRDFLQDVPRDHGAAGEDDAGRGVPRRDDDGHACGLCLGHEARVDLRAAGHDQGAHAAIERRAMDILAVADEKHGAGRLEIFQASGEGAGVHRRDDEGVILLLRGERSGQRPPFKGIGDVGQTGQHLARALGGFP